MSGVYCATNGITSVLHADRAPHNVRVAGDRLNVIDFDDAGFGWDLYEVGVALFAAQLRPYFEVVVDAMVAGYRAERDLSEPDLRLLPMFLLIRGLASLGSLHGRPHLGLASRIAPLPERPTAPAQQPPCPADILQHVVGVSSRHVHFIKRLTRRQPCGAAPPPRRPRLVSGGFRGRGHRWARRRSFLTSIILRHARAAPAPLLPWSTAARAKA